MAAITYHSKICEIAHNAMAHLFVAGLIDAQRMMEFDLLCVSDAPTAELPKAAAPLVSVAAPSLQTAQPAPSKVAMAPQSGPSLSLGQRPSPAPATAAAIASPTSSASATPHSGAALRALREREGVSAAVFARYLDVQPQAVIAWEAGFSRPSASVARLLQIVAEKGLSGLR